MRASFSHGKCEPGGEQWVRFQNIELKIYDIFVKPTGGFLNDKLENATLDEVQLEFFKLDKDCGPQNDVCFETAKNFFKAVQSVKDAKQKNAKEVQKHFEAFITNGDVVVLPKPKNTIEHLPKYLAKGLPKNWRSSYIGCRSVPPKGGEVCGELKDLEFVPMVSALASNKPDDFGRLIVLNSQPSYDQYMLYFSDSSGKIHDNHIDQIVIKKGSEALRKPPEVLAGAWIFEDNVQGFLRGHFSSNCYECHTNVLRELEPLPGTVRGDVFQNALEKINGTIRRQGAFDLNPILGAPPEHLGPAMGKSCTGCHAKDPLSMRARNPLNTFSSPTMILSKMTDFSMPTHIKPSMANFEKALSQSKEIKSHDEQLKWDQIFLKKYNLPEREMKMRAPKDTLETYKEALKFLKNRRIIDLPLFNQAMSELVANHNSTIDSHKQMRQEYREQFKNWFLGLDGSCKLPPQPTQSLPVESEAPSVIQ